MLNQKRNTNIDFLKICLCIFVIAGHTSTTAPILNSKSIIFYLINALARLTVPLFFIITGYYTLFKLKSISNLIEQVKPFARLFLVWQILYLYLEVKYLKNGSITNMKFISDLIFGMGHLWYLIAYVHGLMIFYLVKNKSVLLKTCFALTIFFLGFYLQYLDINAFKNESLTNFMYFINYSRNGIFYAFPYIIFGSLINKIQLSNQKLNLFLALSTVIFCIEIIYNYLYNDAMTDIFISALPISIAIFIKIINLKNNIVDFVFPKTLSTGMYLIQFFPIYICYNYFIPTTFYSYILLFILVILQTLIYWYFLDKLDKKIKILF